VTDTTEEKPLDLLPLIKRRMAWDVVPCPDQPDILKKMGLLPGSEQGNDLEHKASHVRLNQIAPIQHWLSVMSGAAGEAAARAILESHGIEVDEGLENPQMQHYIRVVYATSVAVVANLLDYGIIEFGKGTVNIQ
jgi:hypothetical protein